MTKRKSTTRKYIKTRSSKRKFTSILNNKLKNNFNQPINQYKTTQNKYQELRFQSRKIVVMSQPPIYFFQAYIKINNKLIHFIQKTILKERKFIYLSCQMKTTMIDIFFHLMH